MQSKILDAALQPLLAMCARALDISDQAYDIRPSSGGWKSGRQVVVSFSGDLQGQLAVTFCGSVADQIVRWVVDVVGDPELATDPVSKSALRLSGMAEFTNQLFEQAAAHFADQGVKISAQQPEVHDGNEFHPTPTNLVARRHLPAGEGEVILELSANRLDDDVQL